MRYRQVSRECISVKCQVVHITRSRQTINTTYSMHGQVLDSVDSARYLGVDITSDLSFTQHINPTTANASKSLGYLKRNILTKNPAIREAADKTIVRPKVEYASSVWSPYTKKILTKLKWFNDGQLGGYKTHIIYMLALPKCKIN